MIPRNNRIFNRGETLIDQGFSKGERSVTAGNRRIVGDIIGQQDVFVVIGPGDGVEQLTADTNINVGRKGSTSVGGVGVNRPDEGKHAFLDKILYIPSREGEGASHGPHISGITADENLLALGITGLGQLK